MIVVIDHDEISQLQVTCGTSSLACNSLHSTSISENAVGMIVDYLKTRLVEDGSSMGLGNGKTDSIGKSLA